MKTTPWPVYAGSLLKGVQVNYFSVVFAYLSVRQTKLSLEITCGMLAYSTTYHFNKR